MSAIPETTLAWVEREIGRVVSVEPPNYICGMNPSCIIMPAMSG
jgi:hypothetical protein